MKINHFPRETVEFQPVTVTVNGTPATAANVTFAVGLKTARPVSWLAPVELEGKIGIMVEDLDPGTYKVWAKVESNPEIPVIDCGMFVIN
jgi:hypothetical protein